MIPGLTILIVALAGCLLFLFKPLWFPLAITVDALAYDRQFSLTLWITGFLFVAAQVLLAVLLIRGQHRRATGRSALRFGDSVWVQIIWGCIITVIILGVEAMGGRSWALVIPTGRSAPGKEVIHREVIHVEARQFAWSFHYAGPDGVFGHTGIALVNEAGGNAIGLDPKDPAAKDDFVGSTLRIPAKRDVLLLLHSRDVIHDFFVRELRTKQDIVPGMEIPLQLHVDVPGTYEIACAELCGLGHSQMRSTLIVMPSDAYDRWKAGPQ